MKGEGAVYGIARLLYFFFVFRAKAQRAQIESGKESGERFFWSIFFNCLNIFL